MKLNVEFPNGLCCTCEFNLKACYLEAKIDADPGNFVDSGEDYLEVEIR